MNTLQQILAQRYLRRKDDGTMETMDDMFRRVARAAARAWPGNDREEEFFGMMKRMEFLPNSPTLMNAGTEEAQNAACFVLPVEDSLDGIFDSVKAAALVHKSGGGTGFDFSKLRPSGADVRSTGGVASGPVSFMQVFNAATEAIKQGGKRRGANMGILRVDHPNIEEFITCKDDSAVLTNFNISVGITDEFMTAAAANTAYNLIDPRTGKPVGTRSANEVLQLIAAQAWKNGEPGMVFLDTIERDNPTPALGKISATNPCGEQPLLPYEACHLGSINLSQFCGASSIEPLARVIGSAQAKTLTKDVEALQYIDWVRLQDTVHLAVDFLDSIIDASVYPLEEITEAVRKTRKIGLGFMGLADLFALLGVRYDSEAAETIAEVIANFITSEARLASHGLALQRGSFPAWEQSKYDKPMRNATVTTVAPTGTISMIANCSSGCEPLFGVAYIKRQILGSGTMAQVSPIFENEAKTRGFHSEELMMRIAENGGSVTDIAEIPQDVKDRFRTALEIPWEWHVRLQAAVQRGTDNAVSKTINMPNGATVEDVKAAYLQAWKSGCKGITVYRSGSREIEVVSTASKTQAEEATHEIMPQERPETLMGTTRRMATPTGTLWVTVNQHEGKPFEVFCQIGRAGSDVYAFTEAIARLVSLALRSGVDVESIVGQLAGIGGNGKVGFGPKAVLSVPDAIAKALAATPATIVRHDLCPECGDYTLIREAGCTHCTSCGYSAC